MWVSVAHSSNFITSNISLCKQNAVFRSPFNTTPSLANLVPRAHLPFGQHQDTELWNNQFPETKILGLPASRRMGGFVCMVSRDKVDVDTFDTEGIQYALEKLGKSKFDFGSTTISNLESKRHEGSGNELVDYSRTPFLGADQKARGLWERDCSLALFITTTFLAREKIKASSTTKSQHFDHCDDAYRCR